MAAGSLILKKVLRGFAPVDLWNKVSSLLSELKARIAFKTIGKKQTKTTIITFGNKPKPNQEMNNGAKAILGVISILTKKGYSVLLKIEENDIAIPNPRPNIMAIAYPIIVSRPVTPV